MKLDGQWRQAFGSGDLGRGEDCFYEGAVRELGSVADGWTGKVLGTATYTTFVPADGNTNTMSCTCPRFAKSYLCKHLAATCLAIEEAQDAPVPQADAGPSIDELVDTVNERELRAFVREALGRNELLATLFTQHFGKVDVALACKRMAAQVEEAAWNHSDRGFIDWRHADKFELAYNEIIGTSIKPLVERGDLASAVDLGIQALRCLQRIEIDDSDGFFTSAIEGVERMWEAWLAAGDNNFARLLFERIARFLENAPKNDEEYDIYTYCADMAREFQTSHFVDNPAFSRLFIAMADERLEEDRAWYESERAALESVRKRMGVPDAPIRDRTSRMSNEMWKLNQEASSHSFHLRAAEQALTRWTLIRLRAMRAGGASEEELLKAAGDMVTLEPICQFFVDAARARGDVDAALSLLEGCKRAALEKDDESYPLAVSVQLAELLEGRDVEALRDELLYQLSRVGSYGSHDSTGKLWARIKNTYDETEWKAQRELLLAGIVNGYVFRGCLAAEGLFDRLMDEIEKKGLSALGSHEEELVARYPKRVLKLYLDDAEHNSLFPGGNRKDYQSFARRLSHIKTIPGGSEHVARIVGNMREQYARRPALMDELSRV